VSALGPSPVDIDELIRATGIATRKVLPRHLRAPAPRFRGYIVLLDLDLAGRLQRHGQQLVSLNM
jgi:DNA processing protein